MRLLGVTLALVALPVFSATYYLSPSGNDSNPGTLAAPLFSLTKVWEKIAPGDTVYLRGGTYAYSIQQYMVNKHGTAAAPIKIHAYPGERPKLTRTNSWYRPENQWHRGGIFFSGNYFHFKGIEIFGYANTDEQVESGFLAYDASYNTFELLELHHNGGGFYLQGNSTGNTLLNCDSHHNADPVTNYGNADGFNFSYIAAGTTNQGIGLRAWYNTDDGIDFFANQGYVSCDQCWSWQNGFVPDTNTPAGNGEGFKLGTSSDSPTTITRKITRSLAFLNRVTGFHIQEANTRAELSNNVAFKNGVAGLNFHFNNLNHVFKNNISFDNQSTQVEISGNSSSTKNAAGVGYNDGNWPVLADASDFLSIAPVGVDGPRQVDGSLPVVNFLRLKASSDLVDAGVNVNLPYAGAAPDIGAFESGTVTPPPPGNQAPVANAGSDLTITQPTSSVSLQGSASDVDGSIVSYAWSKVAGPGTQTISPLNSPVATLSGLADAGSYVFRLTVSDNQGTQSSDDVSIKVNPSSTPSGALCAEGGEYDAAPAPNCPAGSVIASITFASFGEPNGVCGSYTVNSSCHASSSLEVVKATCLGKSSCSVPASTATFGDPCQGVVKKLAIQYTCATSAPNVAPTANAGADLSIRLPVNSVTINGSASDSDGSIASVAWTQVKGPSIATLVGKNTLNLTASALKRGSYTFRLTVKDDKGAAASDTVVITVLRAR